MTNEHEYALPVDLDAERAVLGSVLLEPPTIEALAIQPDDFFRADHAAIFAAMRQAWEAGEPIDVVTLGARVDQAQRLLLTDLAGAAPSALYADHYAGIVRQKAQKRRAGAFAQSLYKWSMNGRTPSEIAAEVQQWLDATTGDYAPSRFQFQTDREFLQRPPKQWLIGGVLGVGDRAMVYGESAAGKTFATLDLAVSAALGEPFADMFPVTRPCTVAYCVGEGVGGFRDRLAAALAARGRESAERLFVVDNVPQLFDEQAIAMGDLVRDYKKHVGDTLDILVIDTLSTASMGADENSGRDMGIVAQSLAYAQRKLGCAVLLVHHSNKAGTGERGHSSIRAGLDEQYEVIKLAGRHVFRCKKMKDGREFGDIGYAIIAKGDGAYVAWEGFVQAEDGRGALQTAILALLAEYAGQKMTAARIAEAVNCSAGSAIRSLGKLVDRGIVRRELQRPEDPASNRNPWLYWADDES